MPNPFKKSGMPPKSLSGDQMFQTSGDGTRSAKDLSQEGYVRVTDVRNNTFGMNIPELYFSEKDVEEHAGGYVFDETRGEISGTQVPLYDLNSELEGKIDWEVVRGEVLTGENLEPKGEFRPGYLSDKITWREQDG